MINKKIFLFFVMISCCYTYKPLYSVIVKNELIDLKPLLGGTTHCSLLYNIHKTPHLAVDAQQLVKILKIFELREQLNQEQLNILVEQPSSIVQLFDDGLSVTANLVQKANFLRYTHVENAEIRCASLAALYLLKANINPLEIYPRIVIESPNNRITLDELTPRHIVDEYQHYSRAISCAIEIYPTNIHTLLQRELNTLEYEFAALKNMFAEIGISADERLLSVACTMYTKGISRSLFCASISQLSSHLFELYLFKRIIEQKNGSIAIIAGQTHVQYVQQMLLASGTHTLRSCGQMYFPGEKITGLDDEGFSLLL